MSDTRILDAEQVIETAKILKARIEERFPGSGLVKVAETVLATVEDSKRRSEEMARPNWYLRGAAAAVIAVMLSVPIGLLITLNFNLAFNSLNEFMQFSESASNEMVMIGAAVFFLSTIEARVKRKRALKALHELRSLAHIIDMHQLTKDPERLFTKVAATASSPKRNMTPENLGRYLDYCTELLAIISKIGALYAQRFDDATALAAVDEIEDLTAGLSRKIWQKLTVLSARSS